MLCHERVHIIFYKWVRARESAVGHDIFRKDLRPSPLVYFLYIMFAVFFLSCFYTGHRMCQRFVFYTEYIFKIGMVLYSFSVSTYYVYPLFVYVMEKKWVMLMYLFLPRVDETPTKYSTSS